MGVVIATDRTDAFGVPTTFTGSVGSPFRYTGEPLDASGLTYLRARHYDASVGRFMTRDPWAGAVGRPLSRNRYSCTHSNPATWSDPSGKCVSPVTILCIAVAVGSGAVAFGIRVRASRGNSNTAFTASLDAVSVKVDYTAASVTSISVNAVGATTARGSDTFTYDQANRMITATVAGVTETYAYDGDGVRFSRQVGTGPVTRYVSDVNTGLPVTIDDGGRRYVWGMGLAYAVSGTGIEVYHTDRLGSVRAITDATGAVTATYRTDEFGIPTATTGTSTQPYGFTGEPRDATGLSYLRARHYDPSIGRFMSRDPFAGFVGSPLSLNRYSYVENNPTTDTDPSGKCVPPVTLLCIAGVVAVGAAIGGVAYTGGTIVSNAIQGKDDLTSGWNATDLVISGIAGGVSGGLGGGAGSVLGLGGKVITNAIIGFDATLASMVAGGRRDPAELAIGTIGGGIGGRLDFDFGGSGVTGVLRGLLGGGLVNSGLTALQNLLSGLFPQPSSGGLVSPAFDLAGSRVLGK